MLAVGRAEQSAKRVVIKCGLNALPTAVSNSPITEKERKQRIGWIVELIKSGGTIRFPPTYHLGYQLLIGDDFGDALTYVLYSKRKQGKNK